jgi:hypothetical protein
LDSRLRGNDGKGAHVFCLSFGRGNDKKGVWIATPIALVRNDEKNLKNYANKSEYPFPYLLN